MEKQESAKFIQWLAKKLKVKTQAELEKAISSMGEEKLKQAYDTFKQSNQGSYAPETSGEGAPEYKDGGKLAYLECLKLFKKGGKVPCNCGGRKMGKIPKAQLGALLKTAGMFGTAAKGLKGASAIGAGIKGIGGAAGVLKGVNQLGGAVGQVKNAFTLGKTMFSKPQVMPSFNIATNPQVPNMYNPITTQNTPQNIPQNIPQVRPVAQVIEKGGKLNKIQALQATKKKK